MKGGGLLLSDTLTDSSFSKISASDEHKTFFISKALLYLFSTICLSTYLKKSISYSRDLTDPFTKRHIFFAIIMLCRTSLTWER